MPAAGDRAGPDRHPAAAVDGRARRRAGRLRRRRPRRRPGQVAGADRAGDRLRRRITWPVRGRGGDAARARAARLAGLAADAGRLRGDPGADRARRRSATSGRRTCCGSASRALYLRSRRGRGTRWTCSPTCSPTAATGPGFAGTAARHRAPARGAWLRPVTSGLLRRVGARACRTARAWASGRRWPSRASRRAR